MNEKLQEIIARIKASKYAEYFDDDITPPEKAIVSYYYFWRLKWCGCGKPEAALMTIRKFMTILKEDRFNEQRYVEAFGVKSIYDDELLLCFAYTLDAAGLTEHGSSIGGAWLTQDGEDFLFAINAAIESDSLEV